MLTRKQKFVFTLFMALCMAFLFSACDNSDIAGNSDFDQSESASELDFTQTDTVDGAASFPFTTNIVSEWIWFQEDTNADGAYTSSLYIFNADSTFQRYDYENPPDISNSQSGEWDIDASGSLLLSIPDRETMTIRLTEAFDLYSITSAVSIDDGAGTLYTTYMEALGYAFDDNLMPGTYLNEYGDTWLFESDGTGFATGEGGAFTWYVDDGILKVFFPDGRVGWMYERGGTCSYGWCSPSGGDEDFYQVIEWAFVEYTDSGVFDSYLGGMELTRQGEDGDGDNPDITPVSDLRVVYSGTGVKDITVDSLGNLYIADEVGHRVLKVSTDGVITTVAGTGEKGFSGDGGPATSAKLWAPMDVAVDSSGNLYIADELNYRIRKVTPEGVISTIAGNGEFREGYSYVGWIGEADEYFDGEPANSVGLFCPCEVTVDKDGNVYFYESGIFGPPSLIHRVSADGMIKTVAGGGTEYIGNNVPATSIAIGCPELAVDSAGHLYIANGNCVLEFTPDGMVYTVAGTGTEGYSGDGGLATEAEVSDSGGIAVAEDGTLYIADEKNKCVRMVTTEGVISTIINGQYRPEHIAIAPNGDLFIADQYDRVLKFEAMMTN